MSRRKDSHSQAPLPSVRLSGQGLTPIRRLQRAFSIPSFSDEQGGSKSPCVRAGMKLTVLAATLASI